MSAELDIHTLRICGCICLMTWSLCGLAIARAFWRRGNFEDDDGHGDQLVGPYDPDPQRDPGDWWKHPKRKETHAEET